MIAHFEIKDPYNFEQIRSFHGNDKTFVRFNLNIGNPANDAGLLPQSDEVIPKNRDD